MTGPPSRTRPAAIQAPPGVVLGVPLATLALLVLVAVLGGDRAVFAPINGWSAATGAPLWTSLTLLGDGLVCAVLLVPWVRRSPERVWGALLGALVMVVVLRVFKELVSMPRPLAVLGADGVTVIGPGYRRSAFPSGHAATVFLYAGAWIQAQPRPRAALALLVPASLVGLSRVVVGVHWPSDVLAGALVGWTAAWLGLRWAGRSAFAADGRRVLAAALMAAAGVLLLVDHTGYSGVLLLQRGIALLGLAWGGWTLVAASGGRDVETDAARPGRARVRRGA